MVSLWSLGTSCCVSHMHPSRHPSAMHSLFSENLLIAAEHGITGDVLSAMDHLALADMGINSLGHRLKLLRAVWEIKRDQGIQMHEDDWKPAGLCTISVGIHLFENTDQADAPVEVDGQMREIDKLWDMIYEQREPLVVTFYATMSANELWGC